MAACRDASPRSHGWNFYLINDGNACLDSAVLYRVSTEWGDLSRSQHTDVHIDRLAPGAHALIWQDDGEFRIELALRVTAAGREVSLSFEFPKLYIQRHLRPIDVLGRRGWQQSAEG